MTPGKRQPTTIIPLLLFVISLAGVFSAPVGQKPERERRAGVTPNASPTPTPSLDPAANPLRRENEAQTPQTSPSPQPRTASLTRGLPDLQARISDVLHTPGLGPAIVGIKIASLDTGRILFEENAAKLLRPASNMKLYTISAALERLSPEFRFKTSVYASAVPDIAGVIHGDLLVYGRGDPSFAARFNNGDYFKGIDDLATRVAAAGVKRVEGDLVGDETYFSGPQYGAGWEWEDLQWYYGAEISALTVNDNALDLFVKPGAEVGVAAFVATVPPDPLLKIVSKVTTTPKGTARRINVYRGLAADLLEISGSVPIDDKGYVGGIGISHPALLFVYLLRSSLAQHGVIITGKSRTIPTKTSGTSTDGPALPGLVEITNLQSPPLSIIAALTLKPSQNLYTELILRTLGKVVSPSAVQSGTFHTTEESGLEVVKSFLNEAGVNPNALVLSDGSGLSRNDMVSVEATVQLLTFMYRRPHAGVWLAALPIAGVDGTLKNRMKGTPAEDNVRAKTGSLSSAASLSGYVTTAAGERLVFSIMVNNFPADLEPRAVCIDPITVLLASFSGRSQ